MESCQITVLFSSDYGKAKYQAHTAIFYVIFFSKIYIKMSVFNFLLNLGKGWWLIHGGRREVLAEMISWQKPLIKFLTSSAPRKHLFLVPHIVRYRRHFWFYDTKCHKFYSIISTLFNLGTNNSRTETPRHEIPPKAVKMFVSQRQRDQYSCIFSNIYFYCFKTLMFN
jgi:hypothetical protein